MKVTIGKIELTTAIPLLPKVVFENIVLDAPVEELKELLSLLTLKP